MAAAACEACEFCDEFPKFPILASEPKLPKLPKLARLLNALSCAAKLMLDMGSFAAAALAEVFLDEFRDELCDGGGVALLGGVGAGRDEFSRSILSILSIRSCILGVVVGVLTGAGEIEISRDDVEICG